MHLRGPKGAEFVKTVCAVFQEPRQNLKMKRRVLYAVQYVRQSLDEAMIYVVCLHASKSRGLPSGLRGSRLFNISEQ